MPAPWLTPVLEQVNCAIEAVVAPVSLNLHPPSKQAKETGGADDRPDLGDHLR